MVKPRFITNRFQHPGQVDTQGGPHFNTSMRPGPRTPKAPQFSPKDNCAPEPAGTRFHLQAGGRGTLQSQGAAAVQPWEGAAAPCPLPLVPDLAGAGECVFLKARTVCLWYVRPRSRRRGQREATALGGRVLGPRPRAGCGRRVKARTEEAEAVVAVPARRGPEEG